MVHPSRARQALSGLPIFSAIIGDLPLAVRESPSAGRGLFALQTLPQGRDLYRADPVVCHASPHNLGSTCSHCLRPLTAHSPLAVPGSWDWASEYCSQACKDTATAAYARVERAAQAYGSLVAFCEERGERFPLLAHRLACGTVAQWAGLAAADRAFPQGWLSYLARMRVKPPPQPQPEGWEEAHRLLVGSLASAFSPGERVARKRIEDDFTYAWFSDLMGTMHLNAFRVELLPEMEFDQPAAPQRAAASASAAPQFWRPPGLDGGAAGVGGMAGAGKGPGAPASPFGNEIMGQLASLLGSNPSTSDDAPSHTKAAGSTGTALYFLPSLFNHSCEPSLDVMWPGNSATAVFRTRREISSGEELSIAYIDCHQAVEGRRKELYIKYGFVCGCERCLEEGGDTARAAKQLAQEAGGGAGGGSGGGCGSGGCGSRS